jgi:DNA-binding transcriptional LysR family regulator
METRIEELTDELTGTLTLGVSRTIAAYWLPQLLERFKRKYPRVVPRVFVGNSEHIQNRVIEHELDVGMVERESTDPNLECTLACRDELLVIVAPGHALAGRSSVNARDLEPFPFVGHDPGAAFSSLAEEFFRAGGVNPDAVSKAAELGSLAVIKQFVRSDMGYSIASSASLARERRDGSLVMIPLEPRLYSALTVMVPKDRFRARLHSTFAEFAIAHLAEIAKGLSDTNPAQALISENPHP